MKIIFSPSKEMREENILKINLNTDRKIIFENNTLKLLNILKAYSKEEIANIMKIKGNLLDSTFDDIKNFNNLNTTPAIALYNGVAFKELEIKKYSSREFEYINNSLYILSAFYGLSRPFTLLKKYRLDMTMKIGNFSLYDFWKKDINAFIQNELKDDILINLASGEFSKLIDKKLIKNIINIDFKEYKDNKYTSISTYSKQARGKFLDIIIKKQLKNPEDLKNIAFYSYKLNLELSDKNNFIFTR